MGKILIPIISLFLFSVLNIQAEGIEEMMIREDYIKSSLVVVSPGPHLYSAGGHLALRMRCDVQDVDYIYEFDGVTAPGHSMMTDYLCGKLEGSYIRREASDFFSEIKDEKRETTEYDLNLSPMQEIRLWQVADESVDNPGQYFFSPEQNNCCSMIMRLLDNSVSENSAPIISVPGIVQDSHRDNMEDFFWARPWTGLFWDIILGTEMDKERDTAELIYPKVLGSRLTKVTNPETGTPIISGREMPVGFDLEKPGFFTPQLCFIILLIGALILTYLNHKGRMIEAGIYFDIILFSVISGAGILLWGIFIASWFSVVTSWNILLLVFTPFQLPIFLLRKKRIGKNCILLQCAVYVILTSGVFWEEQIRLYGLWLFIAVAGIRSLNLLFSRQPDLTIAKLR